MADYPGSGGLSFSLVDFTYQGSIRIPDFVERPFDHNDSDSGQQLVSSFISGPHSWRAPSVIGQDHSGSIASSFTGDYYNRIHIVPNPVAFGSVLEPTSQQVELWNAFFSQTVLTDVIFTDFTGLEVASEDIPPPNIKERICCL